jgi:hypothetical protein
MALIACTTGDLVELSSGDQIVNASRGDERADHHQRNEADRTRVSE